MVASICLGYQRVLRFHGAYKSAYFSMEWKEGKMIMVTIVSV